MQAVILAAGQGTRLRPLTDNLPKCLVPVSGVTILDRILGQLPDYIDEAVIVIGYLGHMVKDHLSGYTEHKLIFVESEPLGTAYALQQCAPYLKDRFLVLNGDDLYFKSDLEKLAGLDHAVLVKRVIEKRFGNIVADNAGNMLDIQLGQPNQENLGVIGVYALTTEYFNWPMVKIKNGEFGLPQTLLNQVSNGVKFKLVEADYWFPIGFPQDIDAAEAYLKTIA
jgi:NDP-sugar pyrophosphorylase family protein